MGLCFFSLDFISFSELEEKFGIKDIKMIAVDDRTFPSGVCPPDKKDGKIIIVCEEEEEEI